MPPEARTPPEAEVEPVLPALKPELSQTGRQELTLTGADPIKTLETVRQLNLTNSSRPLDERFGSLVLFQTGALNEAGIFGSFNAGDTTSLLRRGQAPGGDPPGRIEKTRIRGTGASADTEVSIRFDASGNPNFVRDHLGEWTSKDGGKTWTTDGPNFRVRRGRVEIDGSGNYSFENADYGVRSTFSRDGTVTRTLTSADGESYSVTRNSRGVPVKFNDPAGEWTGDGRSWTNTRTGEVRRGSVALTDFGEFRFTPDGGGEAQVKRTGQLERINKLQEEISTQYGVIFGRPGERRSEDGSVHINGVPTEDELKVLKNVLDKTSHESYKGMKVWFIRPDENGETHYAHYVNEGEKPGNHSCGAGCSHSRGLIRSTNGDMVILPRARQTLNGMDGLEGTLLHELAHHEQGERYGHEASWGGPGSTLESRRMAEELGWVYSKRHGTSLLKDKDGGLWKFNESQDNWRWVGGVRPTGKHRLDSEEMRERALVKPSSNYFDYPYEHHAEAVAMYRLGVGENPEGADRSSLAQRSPELYRRIRDFDQRSIDRTFGTENGESRFIRDTTGRLVANTPENRRRVKEQEASWGIH